MAEKQEPGKSGRTSGHYSVGRHVMSFLAILGIVLALWLVVRLKTLVVLGLIAVVLTTGIAPAVVWIEKRRLPGGRHLPRAAAILVVYAAAFFVVSVMVTLVVVPLVQQAVEFSRNVPQYLSAIEKWLGQVHSRYPQVPDYAHVISRMQSQLSAAGGYLTGSVGAVFGFFGGVASAFTVAVLTFYLLLSFEDIRSSFLELAAGKDRKRVRQVMSKMAGAMGGWLRGMILLSAIVGTSVALVMLALGVPYAYVIGIAAAIGEPIPMFGPLMAALLGILIAAFGPVWKLVVVIGFFVVLAAVESNILAPKVMHKQVGLSPLATILALAAGTALMGLVGAVLAVPIAAALRVLYFEAVLPAVQAAQAARGTD